MNQKQLRKLISTGVFSASMMAGVAYADEPTPAAPEKPKDETMPKHKMDHMAKIKDAQGKLVNHSCKGKNDCKGQGGCKGSDGGCAGKNSCKGKGDCAVHHGTAPMMMKHHKETKENGCKGKNDCKGKGGCKTGDHGCKGQNSCKGQGGCSGM